MFSAFLARYAKNLLCNRIRVTDANRFSATPETGNMCGTAEPRLGNGSDDGGAAGVVDDGCPDIAYSYDKLGRLVSTTDSSRIAVGAPESGAGCGPYGAGDNVNSDPANDTVIDDGCPYTAFYQYDAAGNRTIASSATGTVFYRYDAQNRPDCTGPAQVQQGAVCPTGNVGYRYDSVVDTDAPGKYPGQRTRITYPDSKTVTYTYEPDGKMKTVTDWLNSQTTYTYDSAGRLMETQLPNGVLTDNGFDIADRLTSVVNKQPGQPTPTTMSTFRYTLDADGNRTKVENPGTTNYKYDSPESANLHLARRKQPRVPRRP